jgi:glutathione S-transferase
MACIEKNVPHTLEPIAIGSDALGALHPWRRVPIMQHGDLRLYETSAITRYIDEIGSGPSLVPATPTARAVMEQWISAINCYMYDSFIRSYALKYLLPKLRGGEPDMAAVRAAIPNLERDVALLDAGYAGSHWLAGDALSLADLFVAPIGHVLGLCPEGKAALAGAKYLSRALDDMLGRDSFVAVNVGLPG